jgi:hypothetical protein
MSSRRPVERRRRRTVRVFSYAAPRTVALGPERLIRPGADGERLTASRRSPTGRWSRSRRRVGTRVATAKGPEIGVHAREANRRLVEPLATEAAVPEASADAFDADQLAVGEVPVDRRHRGPLSPDCSPPALTGVSLRTSPIWDAAQRDQYDLVVIRIQKAMRHG